MAGRGMAEEKIHGEVSHQRRRRLLPSPQPSGRSSQGISFFARWWFFLCRFPVVGLLG